MRRQPVDRDADPRRLAQRGQPPADDQEAVLQHVRGINKGPLDADAIARLFERIIDEARRLERVVQQAHQQAQQRAGHGE